MVLLPERFWKHCDPTGLQTWDSRCGKFATAKLPVGSLRLGRLSDLEALVTVRMSVAENRISEASRVPVQEYRNFIEHRALFVWVEEKEIIGFSAADPTDGTIWALFVRPDRDGRGIGSALLDKTCRMLKRRGRSVASLSTGPDSKAADFYRRRGWVALGMTDWHELQFAKKLDFK